MSIHIIGIALLVSLASALLLAVRVGLPGDTQPISRLSPPVTTTVHSERIVVMPTTGGQLEIATVNVRESFTRADSKVLFDFLDLGTTASEVRVDAVYRLNIGTARAWPLRIVGKTRVVP